MQKSKWTLFIGIVITCLLTVSISAFGSEKTGTPVVPTPGLVTMLDLGADKCIPCKMMAPVLEELRKELEGVAAITFIDVWKNPAEAKKYGIRGIPTQIFYDKDGKEVGRHIGYLDKKSILEIFAKLGVVQEAAK